MANLQTNPFALAALAAAAVPALNVVGARMDHVGADYAFAHVEDASGRIWVVRLALHSAAEAGQRSEIKLLKSLAGASSGGALPFEVPRPRGSADLAVGGKAIVYAALPGVPLVMELIDPGPGLAGSLGQAVGAFHELPESLVTDAGLPSYTPLEYRSRLVAEVDDAAHTGHVTARLEDRWREQLDRDPWWVFTPVPIHGDMAAEHLLENGGRVSALADFASVQVSDPAEDLAQLLAPLAPDVAGSIVGAYRQRRSGLDDPHLEDRAAFLGEIAVIRWLRHGINLDDRTIIGDARGMLADLDQGVAEEQAQAARAAIAAAAAREKLEAAKQAADDEARERRDASRRASHAAAREHQRNSGSIPRVPRHAGLPEDATDGLGESALPEGSGSLGAAENGPPLPPVRTSVSQGGGISVWGRPRQPDSASKGPSDIELAFATPPPDGDPDAETPAWLTEEAEDGPLAVDWATVDGLSVDEAEVDSAGVDEVVGDTADHAVVADANDDADDDATVVDGAPVDETAIDDASDGELTAGGPVVDELTDEEPAAGEPAGTQLTLAEASDDGPADSQLGEALEPSSQEITQAFLPDFLTDDSEAPADIAAAAANDETEALDRPESSEEPLP
ncbi:MAG: phosphotransferase [Bifidobacteriaceae bacterium]|nr:phosphotransferase [Bifidobacteriaceae bacterium]